MMDKSPHISELLHPQSHMSPMIHEAVAVFRDPDSLQAAIDSLQENGFMHHEMSVLSDEKTVDEKLNHLYRRSSDRESDPDAPRTFFIPREVMGEAESVLIGVPFYVAATTGTVIAIASGGTIPTAIAAAVLAGAGGAALGSIMARYVAKNHKESIQSLMSDGGLVLWVHLRSPAQEQKAIDILSRNGGQNVHVHDIPLYSH